MLAYFQPGHQSNTTTEVIEFPGRAHLLSAQEGWEEIADYALHWAVEHTQQPSPKPIR